MEKNNEFPLEYRRYAASTGPYIPPKKVKKPKADDAEENKDTPAKKETIISPSGVLDALKEKLDKKIDDVKSLTKFIELGYELEEYDLIVAYMKDYLAKQQRDNGIRFNLAMTYLKVGDKKNAKLHLRKILSYDPKFAPAREMQSKLR